MSIAKALTIAAVAGGLAIANTSTVSAGTLADLNATAIAAATNTQAISAPTGARVSGYGSPAFAMGADPAFRSMIKLQMRYVQGDQTITEHCGGTVISSRWIVTAAHCVSSADGAIWDRIDLITGDRDIDGNGTIQRTAFNAIVHAGFEYSTLTNDIALIRLKQPLPRDVVPALLDHENSPSVAVGDFAQAAGWPVTGSLAGKTRLQSTTLSVRNIAAPGYITVSSTQGIVEGVCQGESGGPLMSNRSGTPRLAGILSGIEPGTNDASGEPCMKAGYEMYFTPIATYRSWIDRVRTFCDHKPSECKGGSSSMMYVEQAAPLMQFAASTRTDY